LGFRLRVGRRGDGETARAAPAEVTEEVPVEAAEEAPAAIEGSVENELSAPLDPQADGKA
jgi:hypothetical protein